MSSPAGAALRAVVQHVVYPDPVRGIIQRAAAVVLLPYHLSLVTEAVATVACFGVRNQARVLPNGDMQ
jgi:hypothetical protein